MLQLDNTSWFSHSQVRKMFHNYSPCGILLSLLLKIGEDDKALLILTGSVSTNTMLNMKYHLKH